MPAAPTPSPAADLGMSMRFSTWIAGGTLLAVLTACAPVGAGGRYPLSMGSFHGRVEIRSLNQAGRPVGQWRPAKFGEQLGGHLLRTGQGSWAHFRGNLPARCVDANSLIRINL